MLGVSTGIRPSITDKTVFDQEAINRRHTCVEQQSRGRCSGRAGHTAHLQFCRRGDADHLLAWTCLHLGTTGSHLSADLPLNSRIVLMT